MLYKNSHKTWLHLPFVVIKKTQHNKTLQTKETKLKSAQIFSLQKVTASKLSGVLCFAAF